MRPGTAFEFPPEQRRALDRARRLEWWTIAYLLSVAVTMYLAMGNSQAMKTAWLEDVLSLVPPVVFLLANRIAGWAPTQRFPYGYHRATSIAFLGASLALLSLGLWLLLDAIIKLASAERPVIGGVTLFGQTIWLGWIMLAALLWSSVPAVFLGRAKLPLARCLHDKVLHTDADTNKADWMTAGAAMIGIVGVGLGLWWADAVAAAIISLSVIRDGFGNLRDVITDLMDEAPKTTDHSDFDPLPDRLERFVRTLPWVGDAQVRLREEGHVLVGEVFVVPVDSTNLVERLDEATRQCVAVDWRLHDIVLVPVSGLASADAPSTPE